MQELTYITTCKGRLAHLQQTLPRIAKQSNVDCIVVDYGCPENCGYWVEENFPSVKVIRSGPMDGFNASHARNIGAASAQSPWLGFFDADILLDSTFANTVVPVLESGRFYRAQPLTSQTWGSLICMRSDFARVGGYDEAYIGWGGEDDDLVTFLSALGLKQTGFPAALLNEIAHSDELRTKFNTIQDRWVQSQINQVYLQAKLDLLQLLGRPLSRQDASALFAEIQRTISTQALQSGTDKTISISLPIRKIVPPPNTEVKEMVELKRSLIYRLRDIDRI